jgi:hypothetical protein
MIGCDVCSETKTPLTGASYNKFGELFEYLEINEPESGFVNLCIPCLATIVSEKF